MRGIGSESIQRITRVFAVIAVAVLPVIPTAWAQGACPVCGSAISSNPVVVTDWETNRAEQYHDIACAARQMAARFPWSRAVANSSVSGQRISLSRINGSWRAEPETAVVLAAPAPQESSGQPACQNALLFASTDELRTYREKHRSEIPAGAQEIRLEQLPISLGLIAPPPSAPSQEIAPSPAGAPGVSAPATPQPERPAATFSDVPADHWAAKYVETVRELGLMDGYPDGTFRGGQPVTRYELAAIIARMAEKGMQVPTAGVGAPTSAAPSSPAPATEPVAPITSRIPTRVESPPTPAMSARSSLFGLSGILTAPDATARPAGKMAFTAGVLNNKLLGAGSVGIGDGIEFAATSAWIGDDNRVFVSGKKRIDRLSRPGLDVAAGFTGLGTDTAAFAAATKKLRLGAVPAQLTLGAGSGGILDGIFAGAAVPIPLRVGRFAQSAALLAESVDAGDGRDFNYGLALNVRPDLDLKVGAVNERFAAGLTLGREF